MTKIPSSSKLCKTKLISYIVENIPISTKILDVGAGCGTYSALLKPLGYDLDAIEIFEPYITKYNLAKKYTNVYCIDVMDFNFKNKEYGLIILGDILEHLSENDAQNLLRTLFLYVDNIVISVPYNSAQPAVDGNDYEKHLQPKLTRTKFEELYPVFRCIAEEKSDTEHIAVWVWSV